ncbi:MAG: glucan endo-1,6-beta-glucosidase [Bacteroidetes bacterium]|nr:glucan endo-1,6-beta-glucosidase [Bacteroidota bacterium]
MKIQSKILTLIIFLFLISCKTNDNNVSPDPPTPTDIGKAKVWLTRGDKSKLFNREADLSIQAQGSSAVPIITVDTVTKLQTIEGFGAALTGSSAYLFNKKLSSGARQTLLRKLFDTVNGAGISFLRLTIGASDFSLSDFTYDDLPSGQTDFSLQHFSLAGDTNDVIPILKEIVQITPAISLMGSPWSPPAWMKTNGNMKGGKLKTDCYSVYADYFVRYIQEMKNHGVTITAVTPQNEPLYFTAGYPCMEMQPDEQATFIKNHLGPKFQAAGINTKIIIYDHNWDNTYFAISILNDAAVRQFIAGTAFHAYAGDVSAMSAVHNAYPDKGLYFTEISGGAWATDFGSNLMWNMKNIFIGTTQNWSKCALLWNLALDQQYGPTNNGCSNCRGVVTINSSNGQIIFNEEYYSIAHFSKFVRPGAFRVLLTMPQTLSEIGAVAFVNPDGSKAMIVCNYSSSSKTFSVKQGNKNFSYSIPSQSVASVVW